MKKLFITLSFLFCAIISFGQDTIYYNSEWKGCSKSNAEFYRIVRFDEKNKPVGEIRDYYITGELQGIIEKATKIDKNDDANSVFVGLIVSYYKNGTVEYELFYDEEKLYSYKQEIEKYNLKIKEKPDDGYSYLSRGITYRNFKRYDKAVSDLLKSAEFGWEDIAQTQIEIIGDLYKDQKDFAKALEIYDKAANLKGLNGRDIAMAYLKKSKIYTAQGQHNQAIAAMDKAVNAEPEAAWTYYWRAVAKKEAKQYEAAIADYQKCKSLEPDKTRALDGFNNIAQSCIKEKQYVVAQKAIDKALDFNAQNVNYLITKSRIYTAQEQHNQAIATMDKAVNAEPESAGAYYWRAAAKEYAKQYEASIADYQKCKSLEPNKTRALDGLDDIAKSCKKEKQYLVAHKAIDKALGFDAQNVNYLITKSEVYTAQEQHNQAIATMDKAVNAEPESAEAYYWRAAAKEYAKQYEAAIADYQKCQSLEPDKTRALKGLLDISRPHSSYRKDIKASNLTKEQKENIAKKHKKTFNNLMAILDKQITQNPNDANLWVEKGRIYYNYYEESGNEYYNTKNKQCIAMTNKALSIDPNNTDAYYWRAKAKRNLDKYDEAISDYKKCIELDPKAVRTYSSLEDLYYNNLGDYHTAKLYFDKQINLEPLIRSKKDIKENLVLVNTILEQHTTILEQHETINEQHELMVGSKN